MGLDPPEDNHFLGHIEVMGAFHHPSVVSFLPYTPHDLAYQVADNPLVGAFPVHTQLELKPHPYKKADKISFLENMF